MDLNLIARPDNTPDYVRRVAEAVRRLFDYARPYIVEVSSDHTITAGNELVLVDASAGNVTVSLPPAKDFARDVVAVVRVDASGNTVTIDGDGAELVNGAAGQSLVGAYSKLRLASTGAEWIGV